jgi:geranylgeranyl diphosphate synthase type I
VNDTQRGEAIIAEVDPAIDAFLAQKAAQLADISPRLAMLGQTARRVAAGGKRLRPAFCIWGYLCVAPAPEDPSALVKAAASLDLLHTAELIHDDVMDASDTRRGQPAAHRQFERWHATQEFSRDAAAFGRAAAILAGDLLFKWSAELFESARPNAAAREVMELVRTEVTAGQFLDIQAQELDPDMARTDPDATGDLINTVIDIKTARYTAVRPLQLGAALAGKSRADSALAALLRYGTAIGRAFQLRDDVLGVFGDPDVTGKPAGDDLREGKLTLLVARAMQLAGPWEIDELRAGLGRRDLGKSEIEGLAEIISRSGALDAVEGEIADALEEALHAIRYSGLREAGVGALVELAYATVNRES